MITYAIIYKDAPKDEVQISAFVERLYTLVLNRPADPDGINSWVNVLTNLESSGVDSGYGFVFSDECIGRNLSNEDFVEILYRTFLDRESDIAGKSAWVSQLESGVGREKIFEGFVYSDEYRNICAKYGINVGNVNDIEALKESLEKPNNRNANVTGFVSRCYTKALGRNYDQGGLEAWCEVIVNKENTPIEVASEGFFFSDEFRAKELTDEQYVKILYQTFFDREGNVDEITAWVNVLNAGEETRDDILLNGFANSDEFKNVIREFGLE